MYAVKSKRSSEHTTRPPARLTLPALPPADQGRADTIETLVSELHEARDEMRAMHEDIHRLREELAIVRALAARRSDSLPYSGRVKDDE